MRVGEWSLVSRRVRLLKCVVVLAVAGVAATLIGLGFQPKTSAEAANYPRLNISAINLETAVEPLELQDNQLIAPATIAGSYSQSKNKIMIIGHLSTVFAELWQVKIGDEISYNDVTYTVSEMEYLPKSEVKMSELLAYTEEPTLVLMTCAGESLGGQDYTERLIITAAASSN